MAAKNKTTFLTQLTMVAEGVTRAKKIEDAFVNPADGQILRPSEKEPDQHADDVTE